MAGLGISSPSSDLDSESYDPITHLNDIFSHSSTLSSAPAIHTRLQSRQQSLDTSIHSLVTTQAASDASSLQRIKEAQTELDALLSKIDGVRARALETEQTIATMTADIKRLDGTKRNLTVSMTALKRLQMLTTAFEQLRALVKGRRYGESAQLLAAVIQLMGHFKGYRSVDQIAALSRKVAELQAELQGQVMEEFENAFERGDVVNKRGMLKEGCEVLDVLGEDARRRMVTWYCNVMLKEYRNIFRGNDEAGSLDNISRRYAWFNRTLKTYDAEHAAVFPPHWRVNEQLANSFCASTREDFQGILARSAKRGDGQSLDVNLLLACLQETLDFEHALERRFASKEARQSFETTSSIDDKPTAFEQAISEAFEPYLSLWVESQDKNLAALIPKYRVAPPRPPDEEFSPNAVIPSSTELFNAYRLALNQCAKLSTGPRLLELTNTFAKYLDAYSQQVLFYQLSQQTTSTPAKPLPSNADSLKGSIQLQNTLTILATAEYCSNTTSQLESKIKGRIDAALHSKVDLSDQADAFLGVAGAAIRALVSLTLTAAGADSAWREMKNQPWSRMEEVGDSSGFIQAFLTRLSGSATVILHGLESGKQNYARVYCDNLVDSVTNAYIAAISGCKPVSEVGAEQMLLDSFSLKNTLNELPTLHLESTEAKSAAASITAAHQRRVASTTSKIDPLLKTIQVRPDPPEALVQAYLIHIKDNSESNFRTLLDIKGINKRQDISQLTELFNAHKVSPRHAEGLSSSNPIFAILSASASTAASSSAPGANLVKDGLGITGAAVGSATATTASAASKFDPASFGSALFNAARDGVDRFGTPQPARSPNRRDTLGANASNSTEASRAGSPPSNEAKVFGGGSGMAQLIAAAQGGATGNGNGNQAVGNEAGGAVTQEQERMNLRSLGRFFKRPDVGGFGRFGRAAPAKEDESGTEDAK